MERPRDGDRRLGNEALEDFGVAKLQYVAPRQEALICFSDIW